MFRPTSSVVLILAVFTSGYQPPPEMAHLVSAMGRHLERLIVGTGIQLGRSEEGDVGAGIELLSLRSETELIVRNLVDIERVLPNLQFLFTPEVLSSITTMRQIAQGLQRILSEQCVLMPGMTTPAPYVPTTTAPTSGGNGTSCPEGEYVADAVRTMRRRIRHLKNMALEIKSVKLPSLSFRRAASLLKPLPYARQMSLSVLCQRIITNMIRVSTGNRLASVHECPDMMYMQPVPGIHHPDDPLPEIDDIFICPTKIAYSCKNSLKFRSIDGSCNNLRRPIMTRSMTPQRRLLSASYADGVSSFRQAVSGRPLPGARTVSRTVFDQNSSPHSGYTLVVMQWGQIIDHDLVFTPLSTLPGENPSEEGTDIRCGDNGCQKVLPACSPIPLNSSDPIFSKKKCLEFVRSEASLDLECPFGSSHPLNQVTGWLDASFLYGSSLAESLALRGDHGSMAISDHPSGIGKSLLPLSPDDVLECRVKAGSCFRAGDRRVNEQIGLATMHTLMVRQHNRVETILRRLNPHWGAIRLYQETRKIIIAQVQHVTYNEWLTVVLGPERVSSIRPLASGFTTDYRDEIDSRVSVEFTTAAFRFGHSMVQSFLKFKRPQSVNDGGSDNFESVPLSSTFFNMSWITGINGLDGVAEGLLEQKIQRVDASVTDQIHSHLFTENPPRGLGVDLISLNVQRGRDHGLPSYNQVRVKCGLPRLNSFDDVPGVMLSSTGRRLESVYESVDDVDLFAGGLAERHIPGALVGPTFACLIKEQFGRLKHGDRFWYENPGEQGFTTEQLAEIRRTSLAQFFCHNSDAITEIQPLALFAPFREIFADDFSDFREEIVGMDLPQFRSLSSQNFNARVPCSELEEPNWRFWADR